MQENGFIAKLLFPAGTKDIPLGTPIAILVEDASQVAAFAGEYSSSAKNSSTPSATPAKTETASTSTHSG